MSAACVRCVFLYSGSTLLLFLAYWRHSISLHTRWISDCFTIFVLFWVLVKCNSCVLIVLQWITVYFTWSYCTYSSYASSIVYCPTQTVNSTITHYVRVVTEKNKLGNIIICLSGMGSHTCRIGSDMTHINNKSVKWWRSFRASLITRQNPPHTHLTNRLLYCDI